jgi:hypothetical protein
MVRLLVSRVIAIPRAYLAGPRSDMSQVERSSSWKQAFSSSDEAAESMLST